MVYLVGAAPSAAGKRVRAMQPLDVGHCATFTVVTDDSHGAQAFSRSGVPMVAMPSLFAFVEQASDLAIRGAYDIDEVSVAIATDLRYVAAARIGATVTARAQVEAIKSNRVVFLVTVQEGERLLIEGTHSRAVVDRGRFVAKNNLGG